ncbi:MAG: Gfo/Idh/MocA family oxidoreductase [Planctomycetaceae bacterium]|nr:Gfo/Idh/MocA family oxidoreductase [Planctomycetaceae bacterium]
MIRVGIVGFGYWGPNIVRCFSELPGSKLTAVCDKSLDRLIQIKDRYPAVQAFEDYDQMLASDTIDAVVIATPTASHFAMAKKALERGLHVMVEKPLAETTDQCRELILIAEANDLTLFVGHVFLHSSPVIKLREMVVAGELGRINYISSRRLNLGPVRKDVNALFDLATHDISMMLYLLGDRPIRVSCSGIDLLQPGNHDVCNLTMHFPENRMGMIHVSWIDPRKERVLTVVGDRKMAVYDDLEQEKIKIYDKGIVAPPASGDFADFQISYRYGGSYSPFINEREPLKAECGDFIRCIAESQTPLTDGENGLAVVEVLEAANLSLRQFGTPIAIGADREDADETKTVKRTAR